MVCTLIHHTNDFKMFKTQVEPGHDQELQASGFNAKF